MARCLVDAFLFAVAVTFAAAPVHAQDTLAAPRDTGRVALDSAGRDSSALDPARRPPVGPGGAFLRSVIVPGFGQVVLGRKLTAVVFVAFEAATVGMTLRAHSQVKQARLTDVSPDSALVMEKKRSREDWLVLVGFNHLLAGLEAYVAAHLWDFPADLSLRAVPGGMGAAVTIPMRIR